METKDKIKTALTLLGNQDVLDWARTNCTKTLVDLTKELEAAIAPVELERFMMVAAIESGRYEEFVRIEVVRNINKFFPNGFGSSSRQTYGLAAGWSMWASLFEPSYKNSARKVWGKLEQIMRLNPDWCPKTIDDPLVLSAFSGISFIPTREKLRFDEVVALMKQVVRRGNQHFSELKAVENLDQVNPGYGYIYGLYAVDGQVCNGGFVQFYENTRGVPAILGVSGFKAINRNDFASIVEESIRYAMNKRPDVLATLITRQIRNSETHEKPRPFDELDELYFTLSRAEESNWLEEAMIKLVNSSSELF